MLGRQILSCIPEGFRYIPNFVTEGEKKKLLQIIMGNPWCSHLRRQQQYYGIKYFQTKLPDTILQNKQSFDHLPLNQFDFIRDRVKKTLNIKSFLENEESPNQVLVNKYLKRDNLGSHVEDIDAFGDSIVGLSLGDEDYLKLAPADQYGHNKVGQIKIKMEDRSIYILQRDARYKWKHGIGREYEGKPFKHPEFMRISLTFRDVIETRRKL